MIFNLTFNDKLDVQKTAKQKLIAENEQEKMKLEKEKQVQITEKAEHKIKENLNVISEHTRIEKELEEELMAYKKDVNMLRKSIGMLFIYICI